MKVNEVICRVPEVQESYALVQLEKFHMLRKQKGKFIFAVAKRVSRKARRDNFRATVQATTRIGILVPLCVYARVCRARHEQFTLARIGGRACA